MARGCRPTHRREQVALCLQIYDDNGGLVKQWVNKPRNWWPTTLPPSSLLGGGGVAR